MRITAVRGDDVDYEITFLDVDGNPYDLINSIIYFTAKKKLTDSDDDAVITKEIDADTIEDTTLGKAILSLSHEDTDIPVRDYFFDIQLVDAGGRVTSSYAGKLIIYEDVTKRTSIDIS